MKITKLLKPVALGAGVTIAAELLAPEYVTFAGIGSGLYILYKITRPNDEKPYAIGVEYDKESNKFVAAIKNPSNKPYAIKTQIRLRPEKQVEEGMMAANVSPDFTTLIAETPNAIIIGPNETITIPNELLLSKEAFDQMDGMLRVAISIEDLKKTILKSSEIKASKKTEEAIAKLETAIKQDASPIAPTETIVGPMSMDDYLTITQPTQLEEELDDLNEALIVSYPVQNEVALRGGEEVIPLKSPFVPISPKKRNGHYIGYSETMLRIITKMERMKAKLNSGDAI